ncbi:unnamed protein product [marine sediment metagenome]|uniref:Class I SAM-dependent methyltransferase n=1 Tax=marine sediment metagenome TaxID=412755 RepID=X0SXB3_9ZZZZ
MLPEEFGWLFAQMYSIPDNCIIAEIGSCRGTSAIAFVKGLKAFNKKGIVYCIDPWTGSQTELERYLWKKELAMGPDEFYRQFEHNVKKMDCFDLIQPMRMKSNEAVKHFEDASVDLIFIDGDHSFEATYEDLTLWRPKLKRYGVFCGHDVDMPSVKDAVTRYAFEKNYLVSAVTDNLWTMVTDDILAISDKYCLDGEDCGDYIIELMQTPHEPLELGLPNHIMAARRKALENSTKKGTEDE